MNTRVFKKLLHHLNRKGGILCQDLIVKDPKVMAR